MVPRIVEHVFDESGCVSGRRDGGDGTADRCRDTASVRLGVASTSPDAGLTASTGAATWAAAHPLATELDGTRPGAALAALLAGLTPADVDDAALVEMAAGWERIISWAAATQASVLAEMVRRREWSSDEEFLPSEIAARLSITGRAASNKVDLAVRLDHSPAVADALTRGALDVAKAITLTRSTAHLGLAAARTVQEAVLDRAPGLTCPQLRNAVRRAELVLDPQAATARHERAKNERVVTLTPASDSMAWLTAYLPADDAMRVMTGIDLIARAGDCGDPDDDRGIDARRADALVDVFAHVLDTGTWAGGAVDPAVPAATGRRRYRHPHLDVTASVTSLLGMDEHPGDLVGYGPIPATMARQIAARSTWEPLLVDGRSGTMLARSGRCYRPAPVLEGDVIRRDVTCTFPGCRTPASRSDLDHIEPFDPQLPAAGQTSHANLHALCRHHHRLKTHGGWSVERDAGTGETIWHAPTGHTYIRDPAVLDPAVLDPAVIDPGASDPRVRDRGVSDLTDRDPGASDPTDRDPGVSGPRIIDVPPF